MSFTTLEAKKFCKTYNYGYNKLVWQEFSYKDEVLLHILKSTEVT